jgi:hypothetical protein
MKKHFNQRVGLVAALAAVTATAWATSETLRLAPSTTIPTVVIEEHELKSAEPLRTEDTLAPNEAVVTTETAEPATPVAAAAAQRPLPVAARADVAEAPIVIEQKAMTLDERIQSQVMERIAGMANASGRIGVESHDAVVTLTGYTVTAAQAYRVERTARGVEGVRAVDNQIRARIGGSV